MQEFKKKLINLNNNIKQKIKNFPTSKKLIILIILILIIFSCIIIFARQVVNEIQKKQLEGRPLLEWKKVEERESELDILIKITNINGIEQVEFPDGDILKCNGKTSIGIDYNIELSKEYEFKIKEVGNDNIETEIVYWERPVVEGNYTLVDGMYANEPDISAYPRENTRYLYNNEQGNLIPGNWITGEKPQNWYSYKKRNWANIYVETNGVESYYVWIPRYVYKMDAQNSEVGNERMDIKFVNTANEYIDGETGQKLSWEELKEQGYKLPAAFMWENSQDFWVNIPGYWMSKYQLSELEGYKLNYNLVSSSKSFNVKEFTNKIATSAKKYTYAINGNIVHESNVLEEYSFINASPDQTNIINVTALDENGRILGSMTKKSELVEVNPPDLTGFNEDTTFYVYWDEEGNEHSDIPISMEPPEGWYNYSYSKWANIVTRNNGLESYFVWIPRYQYTLDQVSQQSNVLFIKGTDTEPRERYKIPEAFSWGDNGEKQLTGYWMSKYQLSE